VHDLLQLFTDSSLRRGDVTIFFETSDGLPKKINVGLARIELIRTFD
jgi:hypothetical protein